MNDTSNANRPDQTAVMLPSDWTAQAIEVAVKGVDSPRSKRAYREALEGFFAWHRDQGSPAITKHLVNTYKEHLATAISPRTGKPLAASTVNLQLSAIRKLVREAADNEWLDPSMAQAIRNVQGVKAGGKRAGNWLSKEQAQALVNAPPLRDSDGQLDVKGLRDRAILAVLVLAGLRREEAANLTFDRIQMRDNRWGIVDLRGKRGKVRSVPIQPAVKTAIDQWARMAGISSGYVFRPMRKGGKVASADYGERVSSQAIWRVVDQYARACGLVKIAPHDLRRTYAKLAHKGGSAIEQISKNLGHESLKTTEIYLGIDLDWQNAPSDFIDITIDLLPGA